MRDLLVSEHFYSIQGEGITSGIPAVFLRLKNCNLMCGGFGTQDDKKLHDGATWRCDTIEVWQKGSRFTPIELLNLFLEKDYVKAINTGAHLVITGGEPMLQQDGISAFLDELMPRCPNVYIEIETNGTIEPAEPKVDPTDPFGVRYLPDFEGYVDLWNVSPKLSNSGMPADKRINEKMLRWFGSIENSCFKFVITREQDIEEIRALIDEYEIQERKVCLMPGADSLDDYAHLSDLAIGWCKKFGWRYSPRLHIAVWNRKTGV